VRGSLDFPALPFSRFASPFGHTGVSRVTFYSVCSTFWARWYFQRYLLLGLLHLLGTLDFPALPFSRFAPPFGHAGFSCVTFQSVRFTFRARWGFQRYLLLGSLHLLGTLEFSALPFTRFSPLFGHAGLSCITFYSVLSSFGARWTFLRYLSVGSPHLLGTLDFPALPFSRFAPPFGHVGISSVTIYSVLSSFRARWYSIATN